MQHSVYWKSPVTGDWGPNPFAHGGIKPVYPEMYLIGGGSAGLGLKFSLRVYSIVNKASRARGFVGIGNASYSEAMVAGRFWVGSGFRYSRDGRALISQSGSRQFRPQQYKSSLGFRQANYESRFYPKGSWINNAHLKIRR